MKTAKRNLPRSSPAALRFGPPGALPVSIRNSRLMSVGGFEVFEGFMDREGFALMLAEAVRLSKDAYVSDVPVSDEEEVRGGTPARRFRSVPGGPVQQAFYQSPWLINFLSERCNVPLTPLGGQGTYSFYAEAGDYLAIHRDIEACDLAVITCLYNGPRRDQYGGGALCLYPTRIFEPLSVVRATPEEGALAIGLEPGQTIIMFGGIIPHTLLPVAAGQTRIVSVLCYRAEFQG
ncbi:MAG TPA: hypothetical protein VM095_16985 [Pyrinomonadaceae bacterium]|nr:hypothetical protein [Pyrinomonadaceae bacterium]